MADSSLIISLFFHSQTRVRTNERTAQSRQGPNAGADVQLSLLAWVELPQLNLKHVFSNSLNTWAVQQFKLRGKRGDSPSQP